MNEKQEKKIAENVSVRINLGNYQHVELTKYAEKTIKYENDQEMVKQEEELTDQLFASLIRSMRSIPERLGKKTEAIQEVEESVKKSVPAWLEKDPIPNIANKAIKNHDAVISIQKENKDVEDNSNKIEETKPQKESKQVKEEKKVEIDDDDLF